MKTILSTAPHSTQENTQSRKIKFFFFLKIIFFSFEHEHVQQLIFQEAHLTFPYDVFEDY